MLFRSSPILDLRSPQPDLMHTMLLTCTHFSWNSVFGQSFPRKKFSSNLLCGDLNVSTYNFNYIKYFNIHITYLNNLINHVILSQAFMKCLVLKKNLIGKCLNEKWGWTLNRWKRKEQFRTSSDFNQEPISWK